MIQSRGTNYVCWELRWPIGVIFFDETTDQIILSAAMDTDVHKCSDYIMDDDDQGVYYQVVTGFYLLLYYRRVSYTR